MKDGPEPFDTLETWELHLKEMEALPDSVSNKQTLIRQAKNWIARKRAEGGRASKKAG
jgi:hypothetical protein